MQVGRQTWTIRGHRDYDPNRIGAISQARVAMALVEAGKLVYTLPWQVARWDLAFEDERGFFRVQCKTGRLYRGNICFRPYSLRAATGATGWRRLPAGYRGQVEFFGIYCPDNQSVYLVPVEEAATRTTTLRLEPTRNNQKKRVRWADDFLLMRGNVGS
jgi:hypothetical protein